MAGGVFYNSSSSGCVVNTAGSSGQACISGGTGAPTFGTLDVIGGGTGVATTTAYGLLAGGTTATGSLQNAGTGTSGQILASQGSSALPTWQSYSTPYAFFSYYSIIVLNVTGDGTAHYYTSSTTALNRGSAYSIDGGIGTFTVPTDGLYHFSYNFSISGILSTHTKMESNIVISGVQSPRGFLLNPYAISSSGSLRFTSSISLYLTASQKINLQITVSNGTKVVDMSYSTNYSNYWSGFGPL